jgi:hypothetical protein
MSTSEYGDSRAEFKIHHISEAIGLPFEGLYFIDLEGMDCQI